MIAQNFVKKLSKRLDSEQILTCEAFSEENLEAVDKKDRLIVKVNNITRDLRGRFLGMSGQDEIYLHQHKYQLSLYFYGALPQAESQSLLIESEIAETLKEMADISGVRVERQKSVYLPESERMETIFLAAFTLLERENHGIGRGA